MTPRRPSATLEVAELPRPSHAPGAPASSPYGEGEAPAGRFDLVGNLHVILDARWLVLAVVLGFVAVAAAYAWLATPVFRSDVLLQVEDKKPGVKGLLELTSGMGESSPAETEIEILRSRTITGSVVDALRLDTSVEPVRFPVLGRFLAGRHTGDALATAPLGLSSFAWGGERIGVDRFEVPPRWESGAVRLVAGTGGAYELFGPDGASLGKGAVGAPFTGGGFTVYVSELHARPGTRFELRRVARDAAIQELQDGLRVAEKGKKTGILTVSLEGPDRDRIAAVLDAIAAAYLRQNVDRRSAEAGKTLQFLESQLPLVHDQLGTAEAELERYRTARGGVDVTTATQAVVARTVEVEKAVSELQLEQAALRLRFTEAHPMLTTVQDKLKRLTVERAALDARLKQLPEAELESARRMRDVKVANEVYLVLLNRAQELKVVKEGTLGNVRVLDPAIRPSRPVSPARGRILALALLGGLFAGVGVAFARRTLDPRIEDPDQVERASGIAVFANVPFSESEGQRTIRPARTASLLAATSPRDLAVESLRGLRTAMQFALVEARSQVVAIGGPAPGVGKSFVSSNLGYLLAEAGKRVVLVDADIRRGTLHQLLGLKRSPGLADVIAGLPLDEALVESSQPRLTILPSGTLPPNPAELLGSERFSRLVTELAGRFDIVLLDTPPALAVTDAALVARHAAVNLLVIRSGRHAMREILATVRVFGRSGVPVNGFVMNAVHLDRGLGRQSAYHYQYKYQ